MKDLLIYINPNGFDEENEKLTKIQIDNSLELGWKEEDILLITNFEYEYNGVKAIVIDKGFCSFKKECTKIPTIVHLFDKNFFKDDLYWCHDLDAYQLELITEDELGLEKFDAGLCDYGRKSTWQLGSIFFKKSAEDIFRENAKRFNPDLYVNGKLVYDESIMVDMTNENFNNINTRIKRMNGTYDFGMRRIKLCYEKAIKPLKVLHFHPQSKLLNTLGITMYGKNELGFPLLNKRIIKLFQKYGYS